MLIPKMKNNNKTGNQSDKNKSNPLKNENT